MKEKIRKIIQEEVHAILEIETISIQLSVYYMDKIKSFKAELLKDTKNANWFCYSTHDHNLSHEIFINELETCIIFYKGRDKFDNNHVSGNFSGIVKQKTVDNIIKYDSKIDIRIYNWDLSADLTEKIKEVFDHELHHVFDAAIRINKKSTTKALNAVYRRIKQTCPELIKKHPYLKEFMDVFYLNLPEERNARIHQLHLAAKKYKGLSRDEMIIKLGELAPYKDFQRMYKFHEWDSNHIPTDAKIEFMNYFNIFLNQEIIKRNLQKDNVHYPSDPDKFFEFWTWQFRKNANKLFTDARGIANHLTKNNLTENVEFHFLDGLSDEAIFALIGENFNEYSP